MTRAALLACVLAGACGDDGGALQPDAGQGGGDANTCTVSVDAPWLRDVVTGVVNALDTPRATTTERTAARNVLQQLLTDAGLSPQLHAYATGANVYAALPATTAETARLLVGAHFDTVAGTAGSNDNATGVAAVIAIARLVAEMSCRRYPVTFVLFDEEESGLVGARAYAATFAPGSLVVVHTIDQIGWDADGDRRFELEAPTPALDAAYRASAQVLGVPVATTTTEGTDHQAFRDRGFPAIGLTEEYVNGDTSPYRHTAQDTPSTVDIDYLVLGTQLAAHVIIEQLAVP